MAEFDHLESREKLLRTARHVRDTTGEITNQLATLVMPGGEMEMIATAGIHPSQFWHFLLLLCKEKSPIALSITSEAWAVNFSLHENTDPDIQRVQRREISIADLPREKRSEILLVSYQTRSKTYCNQAEILDNVVGEWTGWMEPQDGRMVNILARAFENVA